MTLHITYTFQCPECSAYYIPYDQNVPCPKCGKVEEKRYAAFVAEAAHSALYNLRTGSYVPGAWWVSGLADHILLLLFRIFEQQRLSGKPMPDVLEEWSNSNIEWGDQEYLKGFVKVLALRVFEQIEKTKHA